MGSSVVLRRRTALSAWRYGIRRAAGPLVFPPCWLQAHLQMGFWEASCRGTGAADGTFDSSTPATCGRRGLIRGDSGWGAALRLQGPGDRSKNDPPASCAVCPSSVAPGTLSRARSGTKYRHRHRHQLISSSGVPSSSFAPRLVTAGPVLVINGVCKCKCKCKCRRPQFLEDCAPGASAVARKASSE